MTPKEFVRYVRKDARSKGIEVYLGRGKRVVLEGNRLSNGWFSADDMKLSCAIGKPVDEWIRILAHEHSHLDQWYEGTRFFSQAYGDAMSAVDGWLDGGFYLHKHIRKSIEMTAECEADCEIRTLKKIEELDLPIDKTDYIRKSNAYILFHGYMHRERVWYKTAPYEIESILTKMPSDTIIKPEECKIEFFEEFDLSIFDPCKT